MTLGEFAALFDVSVSPVELVVRGSIMYWFIFVLFRVVLRRNVGAVGIADVLLLVLIADAAQNAMAGEYRTVTDGIVLVSTIVGWNVLIDWLAFRFPALGRRLEPPPLPLVEGGRILHRNLRREFISHEELMGKLREKGVEDVAKVKRAVMESSGEISVIPADPSQGPKSGKHAV